MPFMSDVFISCDMCDGKRYNFETLQVSWGKLSISDVLDMSVEEIFGYFENVPEIADRLELMKDLGLEYLQLGQSFATLSGGEMQRLKLVAELAKKSYEPTLYILDEPAVGLHFSDVEKLIMILHRLVDKGHSVLCVEHNLDFLKQCDWLIELGPVGGPGGGNLLFEGAPTKMIGGATPTGRFLK
jgi:excinuclease ABC subunit A